MLPCDAKMSIINVGPQMRIARELCSTFLALKGKNCGNFHFSIEREMEDFRQNNFLPGMVFHQCEPFGGLSEQSLM